MNILKPTQENILKAGEVLKKGGLVAFPTETVYGLGANVFDAKAVTKIFQAKKRPSFDPLITHIADKEFIYEIAYAKNERVKKVMDELWPGPLTIIVEKKDNIPDIVTSGLSTMAVRMPANDIALKLIQNSTHAIAAPSANPFGYLSPTMAEHVYEQLGKEIDFIIDGGLCKLGVESTVLDLTKEIPIVLRPGGMEIEKIEKVLGKIDIYDRTTCAPTAPGQLPNHYSPGKPLYILENIEELKEKKGRIGILSFNEDKSKFQSKVVEVMSSKGDLLEAASRLFYCLHNLDKADIDEIYVQGVPKKGLGIAIMDRLYKASKK